MRLSGLSARGVKVTAEKRQIHDLEQDKRTATVPQTPGKGLILQNMKLSHATAYRMTVY